MSDAVRASAPRRWRRVAATALLLLGLLVAFVPGLLAGDEFLYAEAQWDWLGEGPIPPPPAVFTQRQDFVVASAPDVRVNETVETRTTLVVRFVPGDSLVQLVQNGAGWGAATAALAIAPLLFLGWRRRGVSFGRAAGIATCAAAAAAVCALVLVPRGDGPHYSSGVSCVGVWWTVPLGAVLMGAAFVVAPAPVRSIES